jgi:hypothetical protein
MLILFYYFMRYEDFITNMKHLSEIKSSKCHKMSRGWGRTYIKQSATYFAFIRNFCLLMQR